MEFDKEAAGRIREKSQAVKVERGGQQQHIRGSGEGFRKQR